VVLVELSVAEQRHRAVLEVLDGAAVTVVARRYGVARQTVHRWMRRYAADGGLANLVDRSCRPGWCPHQMPAATEVRVIALRWEHRDWGPDRIRHQLTREELLDDRGPSRRPAATRARPTRPLPAARHRPMPNLELCRLSAHGWVGGPCGGGLRGFVTSRRLGIVTVPPGTPAEGRRAGSGPLCQPGLRRPPPDNQ
jgi:transposase